MISLKIPHRTKEGLDLHIGDVIKSPSTHAMVIQIKDGKYIVRCITPKLTDAYFPIREFIDTWYNIEILYNVNISK